MAFYDVIAAGDRKLAGPLCGTKAPSQLKTSSNQVRIHFFSDATVPDKGFLISFKAHGNFFHSSIVKSMFGQILAFSSISSAIIVHLALR